MKPPLRRFRAVQMDLARQYERPDQICRFITEAAGWGFTHVVLYLEGRIRTKSFPFPDPKTSYDATTMRKIVKHAAALGVELVPVVPSLGHTEQFLRVKALSHLAECQPGAQGRLGPSHGTCACPSKPETFSFFTTYYREIATIFPSRYFHIGMDESWDLGSCPICKRSVKKNSLGKLFGTYVSRIVRFVEQELGREVLMWDDMFEACPDALAQIPTSVILCVWLYDEVFERPWSRFFNRTRMDLIPFYASHGFRCIASSRETSLLNVDSVTAHGLTSQACIGGLVTSWEHSMDFPHTFYPVMSYAARLWSSPKDTQRNDIINHALQTCFGKLGATTEKALEHAFSRRQWVRHWDLASFSRGLPSLMDRERALATAHILASLSAVARRDVIPSARHTWDCMMDGLAFEIIQHTLSEIIPAITRLSVRGQAGSQAQRKTLARCETQLQRLLAKHRRRWASLRRGILPDPSIDAFTRLIREIHNLRVSRTPPPRQWLIRLHGFLPDRFGVPVTSLAIRTQGQQKWHEIYRGVLKACWDEQPYPEYWIPCPALLSKPTAMRLEVSGHGGHGYRFVEIETSDERYVPARILETQGHVETPDLLLKDDKRWTWLGPMSVRASFDQPEISRLKHTVTLALEPSSLAAVDVLP